jgi:hypothetical protein
VAQQYQLPDGRIVEATPDGKYRVVSGGPSAITGGDPKLPGALTGQQLGNAGQATHNARDAATLPYDIRAAKAAATTAEINARNAQDQFNAAHPPVSTSGLFGPDYLKTLSQSDQNMVKALSEGRLAFPQGAALRAPFWQEKLSQVAQFDPTFDATDFNARAKGRANAISGKLGQSNNALNTALGHAGTLYEQIGGTASHGGFPFATTVNAVQNAYEKGRGEAGITNFTDTASKLADEMEAVYRNGGGAEQGVVRQLKNLDPNMSLEQKQGVIKNAMELLASKMAANISQYNFGTMGGKPHWEMLDPHSQQVLDKYAPDIRDKYFAVPAASPNGPPPPNGGSGFAPAPTGGDPGLTSSKDGFNDVPDPQSAAFWEQAARSGTPYPTALKQWQSDVQARGLQAMTPPPPGAYHKASDYIRKNPSVEYHPFSSITHQPQAQVSGPIAAARSLLSTGPGVGVGHFVNQSVAGLPAALAGDEGRYYNAVTSAEHPNYATAGDIAGATAGMIGLNKGVGAIAPNLGRVGKAISANPARQALISDTLFGGGSGAANSPDDPFAGAVVGAGATALGNVAGQYALAPVLRGIGGTGAGRAVVNRARGMFGGGSFNPVSKLEPGEQMLYSATSKPVQNIRSNLNDAIGLDLPYSLADSDPKLRMLLGSASRKSPNVRQLAEDTIGPRNLGQAERAIGQIDAHLAPIQDVSTIKADAVSRARKASQPLYSQAKSQPAPDLSSEPALGEVLSRPASEAALRKGYTIALNEGANPAELSFATGPNGQTILNGNPTWQTIHYVRRGLDEEINGAIDPVTGKVKPGMSDSQGAMIKLRGDLDKQIGRLNPTFKQADAAYGDMAGQGTAAERGAATFGMGVKPGQAQAALNANFSDLPYFRKGYASAMADKVGDTRFSTDPYNAVYGTPHQQEKLGIVFPQGSQRFARARQLESDMSKTHYETLGGSPTASRQESDKLFDNGPMGMAADGAFALATGTPPPRLLERGLSGLRNRFADRISLQKADAIGPLLADTDPRVARATLDYIQRLGLNRQNYVNNSRYLGGMFGAPVSLGLYEGQ